jgi:hypothetical protein
MSDRSSSAEYATDYVGRFRSRSDADGHLRCLRQLIPHASFVVVFDLQPDIEAATDSPASTEEVVI